MPKNSGTISPRKPVPKGATVETVFEVRVQAECEGATRAVLTRSFLRTVREVTGLQCLVVGYQVVTGPKEETPCDPTPS